MEWRHGSFYVTKVSDRDDDRGIHRSCHCRTGVNAPCGADHYRVAATTGVLRTRRYGMA
jgi:hypothetical protein